MKKTLKIKKIFSSVFGELKTMAVIKLTTEQKKLIEKIGVYMEHAGSAPVEGRISALLLVSDEPELSFDDIHETLGISKSAASNTINVLLTTNKIDYITKHGDRKRYFRTRLEKWEADFGKNVEASLYEGSFGTTSKNLKRI